MQMSANEYKKASAAIKKNYRAKARKEKPFLAVYGLPLVMTVLIVGCGFTIITNKLTLEQKKQELEQIRREAELLEAENASYDSILNEEDERRYMEKIASERLGYAYPDEKRFYDTVQLS